jgi:60 kDa SS-A/Ro ribonucleoprotein
MARQTDKIAGREDMIQNNAGGFSFAVTPEERLKRFLILGSESNTYYQTGATLAKENSQNILQMLRTNAKLVIDTVVEISEAGRAPKNDYALFVLALAASDSNDKTRALAFEALPKVARTGTHLFNFVEYAEQFRGWGKAMRKAIGLWYLSKDVNSLAYGVVKYQSRDGWSNRDLLRKAHPKAPSDEFDAVFRWINQGLNGLGAGTHKGGNDKANPKIFTRKDVSASLPAIIGAFEEAKTATETRVIELIRDHNLPREGIPTTHLNSPAVWEALLQKMPMEAMIRNLATMTRNGLVAPGSAATKLITSRLDSMEALKKARIHPMKILMAWSTYTAGRGVRGSNTWTPVKDVSDALDHAFYKAFGNVTPTGKKSLLALDVSGSMDSGSVAGFVRLTPREVAMAMSLITLNVEDDVKLIAFTSGRHAGWSPTKASTSRWGGGTTVTELNIDPKGGIRDAINKVNRLDFGGTDCSLPTQWAAATGYKAEAISVYTDNETHGGYQHPSENLKKLRAKFNIPSKLAVFGVTATSCSIADPNDAGMMDFVGFDSAAPELAAQFFMN